MPSSDPSHEAPSASLPLSVVIPFRDEADSLEPLWAELASVLEGLGHDAEVIFVDDASEDAGPSYVRALSERDSRVRLLSLTPHVGQSAALDAGFRVAGGDWVATLDADLQNDPADLPRLLALRAEADCVCGIRTPREDRFAKRLASRVANGVRRRLLRDGVTDIGCSLRVMRRSQLDRIKMFRGGHRFLPSMLAMEGARIVERPVRHRPRRHGRSKYGILGRLRVVGPDLLAMLWLARRVDRYEAKELSRRA
jgi:glycosyltransferase involved in cell wall biosynthesis